ncbi:MAG: hypothetical protein ACP6IQ_02475 [Candidatus Njordarchaeia archaeon]
MKITPETYSQALDRIWELMHLIPDEEDPPEEYKELIEELDELVESVEKFEAELIAQVTE